MTLEFHEPLSVITSVSHTISNTGSFIRILATEKRERLAYTKKEDEEEGEQN